MRVVEYNSCIVIVQIGPTSWPTSLKREIALQYTYRVGGEVLKLGG